MFKIFTFFFFTAIAGTWLTFYFLLFTSQVSAHLAGQPPFFKVNGIYSNLYPVPLTSLPDFELPQDLAPQNYLVGQEIEFEVDTNVLPMPKEIIEKSKFSWDFGDGTSGEGLKNKHTYSKPGSYFTKINVAYENNPSQLIQSTLLHVLPAEDYVLPVSVIVVNGKQSKDPLTDILKFNFRGPIELDGSKSKKGSANIVEYFWDFGDGKSGSGIKSVHSYDPINYAVFPVLRVKDENGFIADSYVQLVNDESTPVTGVRNLTGNSKGLIIGAVLGIGILSGLIFFWASKKYKKIL